MKPKMVFSFMDKCVRFLAIALACGASFENGAWAVSSDCMDQYYAACAAASHIPNPDVECGAHVYNTTRDASGETRGLDCIWVNNPWGTLAQCPGYNFVGSCKLDYLVTPPSTPPNTPTTGQSCLKGSIVQTDSQNVGESVPLNGTPFDLVYFTSRVQGRTADYSILAPLTGSSIPADQAGTTVTLGYLGRTETFPFTSLNTFMNLNWTWDGKDQAGNLVPGSTAVQITASDQYAYEFDYPLNFSVVVGSYKAIVSGLGGWTISAHHFIDIARERIYQGDGSSRDLRALELFDNGTHYFVGSEDGSEVYVFDLNGRHLFTKQGLTGSVIYTFAYDTQGRLQSITDAYSNVTQVLRDSNGALTGIQGPYGHTTNLTLGSDGYLATIQNPNGETYAMTYYSGGLLHTFQKPRGQTSTFTYDAKGFLLSDSNSAGNALSFLVNSYNQSSGVTSLQVSTALNRSTLYSLSQQVGQTNRTTTYPDGSISSFAYAYNQGSNASLLDNRLQFGEGLSQDPRFAGSVNYRSFYSVNNNLGQYVQVRATRTVSGGTGGPFSFTNLDDQTTLNGSTWDSLFTLSNLTTSLTSPLGRVASNVMNTFGKPVSTQVASYTPVQYSYDTHGRLSNITQGQRGSLISYNANGYVSSISNPLNQSSSYTYDNAGRVLTQTLPDQRVITYSYDSNGNLTGVTPPSSTQHQLSWNNFDFPSSYAPPVLGSTATNTTYSYNNDRQLTQIHRPDGSTVALNYDVTTGALSSMTLPSGSYSYSYSIGLLASAMSADSIKDMFSYAGAQLASDSVLGSSGSSIGRMTFQYGAQLASASGSDLLLANSVAADAFNNSISVSFSYDSDNLLVGAGNETLTHDASSGFLTGTTLDQTSESLTYDSTYGELSTYSASYNSGSKTKSKKKSKTLVSLLSQSFTRDALGRITGKSETVGTGSSNAFAYTYDSAGRLTDVTLNGTASSHYVYDSNSNRTSGATRGVAFTATYDAQDRLLTYKTKTYAYNLNGERTLVTDSSLPHFAQKTYYGYDALGNLNQVATPGQTITYQFDGLNRRQSKIVGFSLQAQYLYEDQYRVAAVLDGSGAITQRFVYGSKPNVPDYVIKSGTKYKIISDPNGSVRLVVNSLTGAIAQQIDYDEFGKVINDTSPGFQPFGFAGGLYDVETGIVHFGARDYDASVGRWLQKDPIGFDGGDTNLYGYVANDPINWIDPEGLYHFVGGAHGPLSPALNMALNCFDSCTGLDTAITSGNDSHGPSDPHSSGNACDIGRNSNPGLSRTSAQSCFNQCFAGGYGQEEHNSGPGTHFHFQIPPGVNGGTGFAPGIQPHGPARRRGQ